MLRNSFKPGELVRGGPLFWVHHYQHRMPHVCRVVVFSTFPECSQCGARVRFEPASVETEPKAMRLADDVDFKRAAARASG